MSEPLKLFICYRSSDAPKVDKIARNLALLRDNNDQPRYIPWQDRYNLPPGHQNWWDAIVDAIDECSVFIFHISQGSLESAMCLAELNYAYALNRPIVPIVLEGEFILDPISDRYSLPEKAKQRIPSWLGNIQFLFYTGADFYSQFEQAIDIFRQNWPRFLSAVRPSHPNNPMTNHARYDLAWSHAESLAFAEARENFGELARRNDALYGEESASWLKILKLYEELIDADKHPRLHSKFRLLWDTYLAQFSNLFGDKDWLFDPERFANKMAEGTTVVDHVEIPSASSVEESSATLKHMTAEEYFERANFFRFNRRYRDAITDYTEALRLNPTYAEAYSNRGDSLIQTGSYERAFADFNEAIRLDPQLAEAYHLRGYIYFLKNREDLAFADHTEAIRLDPNLNDAYYRRGLLYEHLEDYDHAIADYDAALRLNPNHVLAIQYRAGAIRKRTDLAASAPVMTADQYFERADKHRQEGRYDQAIADYTKAIHINPQYIDAYYWRGYCCYYTKEYQRAIFDYDKVLNIDPNHFQAREARQMADDAKKAISIRRWFGR